MKLGGEISPKRAEIKLTTGPTTGPAKGARANILNANARSEALKQSEMTPPEFVSGEEPKKPARKLRRGQRLPFAPRL